MTDQTQPQLKTMKILWIAMLGSTIVYLVVAFMHMQQAEPSVERSKIANLIWLIGVGFVATGFVLPKMLFRHAPVATRLTVGNITRYAMFEVLAICGLTNYLIQGTSFLEAAIGIVVAFALILFHPPAKQV